MINHELTFPQKTLIFLISVLIALVIVFAFIQKADAQITDDNYWLPQPWLGEYVQILPVRETNRLPNNQVVFTGRELPNTYSFRTLALIVKERGIVVQLSGRENKENNVYVGKFSKYCTPDGAKLAILIDDLLVNVDGRNYPAIADLAVAWDSIRVTWRSHFTWSQIEPLLKQAFIKAGFAPDPLPMGGLGAKKAGGGNKEPEE